MTTVIDGSHIGLLLLGGYKNLARSAETVNGLNVFPVPDGDTGTNMTKTLEGGLSAPASDSISEYMHGFSRNTLMSARGNSGVILSQFIKGFCRGIEDCAVMDTALFSRAMSSGVDCAYKAVLEPVEGTMLTVLRDASEFLEMRRGEFDGFEDCFGRLIGEMKRSLEMTPEKLPILKEAGVVDSGGAGMLCIFEGMEKALRGEEIDDAPEDIPGVSVAADISGFGADSEFEWGYCTEYVLQLLNKKCNTAAFELDGLVSRLEKIGTSIVCARDGDAVKIHVHTETPEKAIEIGRSYGELLTVKIENMSVQHSEVRREESNAPRVKYAVVAVAAGEGIKNYFKEVGVSEIVDGGQTHNPSAEDMIQAFKKLNAEHIVLLPNNKNVILAAQQAARMYKGSDVRVIPTVSVAEGYSALSTMDTQADTVEDFVDSMSRCLGHVTACYVTTATRSTVIGGVDIRCGDYIGLADEKILCAEKDKVDAADALLKSLPDIGDKEVITVFCGADVTEEDKAELYSRITEKNPLMDCAFIDGGQELYSFIMSVE